MKLIVLRDENSKFFKSYWKKWYELGRGRQQLRLEERQQALHELMECPKCLVTCEIQSAYQ